MNKKNIIIAGMIVILLALIVLLIAGISSQFKKTGSGGIKLPDIISPSVKNTENVEKFSSKDDLLSYLKEAGEISSSFLDGGAVTMNAMGEGQSMDFSAPTGSAMGSPESLSTKSSVAPSPRRISETNVQVLGIDEPDIAKTDGKNIYFSSENNWIYKDGPMPLMEERAVPGSAIYPVPPRPDYQKPKTKIIKAFPYTELEKISSVEKTGNLLLIKEKNILVVLNGQEITGYDIADPKNPKEKWLSKLEDKTELVESRLNNGKIYLVTRNYLDSHNPCPLKPLMQGTESASIACEEIYHPKRIVPADSAFSVLMIDPTNGKIKDKTSFIGSTSNSQVYMSQDAVYVAYAYTVDMFKFLTDALSETGKGVIPDHILARLNKIKSYEISDQAKMTEFQKILEDYKRTLSNDEELRVENEMQNGMKDYFKEHSRDLEKTGIVKIDAGNLKIAASGSVPGHLLNQFSLDEHEGNLRVATSIGGRFWGWGAGGAEANVNDVYVLDKNLNVDGSIKGLGVTERIYSARFLGNRGYLVTFRQTDPFYVLDLSNPKKPEMKGELKIPGFSSYLHPLADDVILGVGQEAGKVKLSLFDVKNASDPREIDKYLLSEYWSEAQNNHHAFLQDAKHEIFFLPGGKGGYVFSYENNKLNLKKAVSDYQVKRAVYIDNYLYIIGENKISVLDEKSWEKVKELEI